VNGEWDVQSILKVCPMGEDAAIQIFARLLDRNLIALRPARPGAPPARPPGAS